MMPRMSPSSQQARQNNQNPTEMMGDEHRNGANAIGVCMTNTKALIERAYSAFNKRDIDGALALMTEDVSWPKAPHAGWDLRAFQDGGFSASARQRHRPPFASALHRAGQEHPVPALLVLRRVGFVHFGHGSLHFSLLQISAARCAPASGRACRRVRRRAPRWACPGPSVRRRGIAPIWSLCRGKQRARRGR